MLHSILRSLRGSLVELTKCEPVSNQSEIALRSGLEKSVLFLLCSSAIMGTSALILKQSTVRRSNFRIPTPSYRLCAVMAKLIWTNGESSFFEFGTTAFNISACLAGGTISALTFASLMISYYIASSKRFYDIAILSCVCDPISVNHQESAILNSYLLSTDAWRSCFLTRE
ncbi:hypothetical protein cyc_05811 [Cyclospora cayetanensis]|uniref:Transmembrane protein n=1 Tax=Cyclospora cayetanensis TaxID=88456 RepID=A0A1D3CXP7_9EIME|nr:hypothetical protein cyc_05811 [Cyclospora cayetanensis]